MSIAIVIPFGNYNPVRGGILDISLLRSLDLWGIDSCYKRSTPTGLRIRNFQIRSPGIVE